MKHCECANFLHLDCEKGMCAMHKIVVPIDGEGSDACPSFEQGFMCQFCEHFTAPDKYGIGTCDLKQMTGHMLSAVLSAAKTLTGNNS